MTKVVNVTSEYIEFENGARLSSSHEQDCCENHYLSFNDVTTGDFEGLEFDLSSDGFYQRIPGYGIALIPQTDAKLRYDSAIKMPDYYGSSVKIPGYSSNNGYYSSNLTLVLSGNGFTKTFDITECQDY